jgi:hypothetical protein
LGFAAPEFIDFFSQNIDSSLKFLNSRLGFLLLAGLPGRGKPGRDDEQTGHQSDFRRR